MAGKVGTLTMGPVLFNWQADVWRDFYFRVADEAPVETVYVGEAVCAKRAPFFEPHMVEVAERLAAGGKQVVFSTLAEVVQSLDRKLVRSVCAMQEVPIEANDAAALPQLAGRAHHIGPFLNTYNEDTLAFLARNGAVNACLPGELPQEAIAAMGAAAEQLGVTLEVQVFGRMPLALSARCYHARAHGRTKDNCLFVCEKDADGLDLATVDGTDFLAINGIQTMSHPYLNLLEDLEELIAAGVSRFRLSPHGCDMVAVANLFREVLDGRIDAAEGTARLEEMGLGAPLANGFVHKQPGYLMRTGI